MRKYNPTLAELIDRLSITILKEIFISEHKEEYIEEQKLILHDIDLIIKEKNINGLTAKFIYSTLVIMLSNRYIWENESKARLGESQDLSLLKVTHSINGVRNTAKNVMSAELGERQDYKIDCLASDLPKDLGNWNIFQCFDK